MQAAKLNRLTRFLVWEVWSSKQNNTGNLKQHKVRGGRAAPVSLPLSSEQSEGGSSKRKSDHPEETAAH